MSPNLVSLIHSFHQSFQRTKFFGMVGSAFSIGVTYRWTQDGVIGAQVFVCRKLGYHMLVICVVDVNEIDGWHAKKGYLHTKRLMSFLWDDFKALLLATSLGKLLSMLSLLLSQIWSSLLKSFNWRAIDFSLSTQAAVYGGINLPSTSSISTNTGCSLKDFALHFKKYSFPSCLPCNIWTPLWTMSPWL